MSAPAIRGRAPLKPTPNPYKHTKQRMLQRYGLHLNRREYDSLSRDIHEHRSLFVYAKSLTATCHWLCFKGRVVLVMYDRKHHNVVTALPQSAAVPYRYRVASRQS